MFFPIACSFEYLNISISESKNCFATSYGACVKEQTIDLVEEGVSVKVLDTMKPDIDISEW